MDVRLRNVERVAVLVVHDRGYGIGRRAIGHGLLPKVCERTGRRIDDFLFHARIGIRFFEYGFSHAVVAVQVPVKIPFVRPRPVRQHGRVLVELLNRGLSARAHGRKRLGRRRSDELEFHARMVIGKQIQRPVRAHVRRGHAHAPHVGAGEFLDAAEVGDRIVLVRVAGDKPCVMDVIVSIELHSDSEHGQADRQQYGKNDDGDAEVRPFGSLFRRGRTDLRGCIPIHMRKV